MDVHRYAWTQRQIYFFFWKGNQTITRPFSHEEYYGTQKKATLQFCNLC